MQQLTLLVCKQSIKVYSNVINTLINNQITVNNETTKQNNYFMQRRDTV